MRLSLSLIVDYANLQMIYLSCCGFLCAGLGAGFPCQLQLQM